MKDDQLAELTIFHTVKKLKMMARSTDLNNPDKVKRYLAEKEGKRSYIEALSLCYTRYARYNGIEWKAHRALIKAKLEPYLGFLHSVQHGKPSLVCDFIEIYRYLIDDFLIEYCRSLNPNDFIIKTENVGRKKQGKREYLTNLLTRKLIITLETFFEREVEIPRIKHGKRQTFDTLINEEALLLGKYLRKERKDWNPRIPKLI